jgi:hypothetical protein
MGIELQNKTVIVMLYWPEDPKSQPGANIKFVSRGAPNLCLPVSGCIERP